MLASMMGRPHNMALRNIHRSATYSKRRIVVAAADVGVHTAEPHFVGAVDPLGSRISRPPFVERHGVVAVLDVVRQRQVMERVEVLA